MDERRGQLIVWGALLALLALTVAVSFVAAGIVSLTANFGIAVAEAALVFWFFMHLRDSRGLVRIVALGAGAWLLIMMLLTSSDYATRYVAF